MTRERRVSSVTSVGMGRRLFSIAGTLLSVVLLLSTLAANGLVVVEKSTRSLYFNFPSVDILNWKLWEARGAEGLVVCIVNREIKREACYSRTRPPRDPSTPGCTLPDVSVKFTLNKTSYTPFKTPPEMLVDVHIPGNKFSYVEPDLFCHKVSPCTLWDALKAMDNPERRFTRHFMADYAHSVYPQVVFAATKETDDLLIDITRFDVMLSLWTPEQNLLSRVMYLNPAFEAIAQDNVLEEDDHNRLYNIVVGYLRDSAPAVYYVTNDPVSTTPELTHKVKEAKMALKWLYLKHVIGDPQKRLFKDDLNLVPRVVETGIPVCKKRAKDGTEIFKLQNSLMGTELDAHFVESNLYRLLKCSTLKYLMDAVNLASFNDNRETFLNLYKGINHSIEKCQDNYFNYYSDAILTSLTAGARAIEPVSPAFSEVAAQSVNQYLHQTALLISSMVPKMSPYSATTDIQDFPRCMALVTITQRLEILEKREVVNKINRVLGLLRPAVVVCERMFALPAVSGRPKELRPTGRKDHIAPGKPLTSTETNVETLLKRIRKTEASWAQGGHMTEKEMMNVLRCTFLSFAFDTLGRTDQIQRFTPREIDQLDEKEDLCKELRVEEDYEYMIDFRGETAAFFDEKMLGASLANFFWIGREVEGLFRYATPATEEQELKTAVDSSKPKSKKATIPVGSSKAKRHVMAIAADSPQPNQQAATTLVDSSTPKQQAATTLVDSSTPRQQAAATLVDSSTPKQQAVATLVDSSTPKQQAAATSSDSSKPKKEATVEQQEPERSWLLMGSAGTLVLGLACVSGVVAHSRARRASEEVANEEPEP